MLTRLIYEARNVLGTPAPCIRSWNSHAESHPVGAEFIIMDKSEGIPLSQAWDSMKLPQKLQVLLTLIRIQNKWLSVSFSHYGSLYYSGDVQSPLNAYYTENGNVITNSKFTIGPATGRDWVDAGRTALTLERGPCTLEFIPPHINADVL